MEVVARRGFGATVDEIAKVSGVSPRTVFRHYANHDLLIATTVRDMYEASGQRPITNLPTPDKDLDGWIDGLAVTIHTRNAEILGRAFWDIHAPRHSPSRELSELDTFRRQYRTRGVHHLATIAWTTAGGTGAPPRTWSWRSRSTSRPSPLRRSWSTSTRRRAISGSSPAVC